MTSSPAASKKRKRDTADGLDNISLQISSQPKSQLGPVIVSYPAVEPLKKTAFKCYLQKERDESNAEVDFASLPTLIAGETTSVEFTSPREAQTASLGSRYLIGIHDKRTKTTVLRPAPLHVLGRQVKKLKGLEPTPLSALERLQARQELGEVFGSKKAKAAIRATERNKVDVAAMEGVVGHIQDSIEKNTEALPTEEEAKEHADSSRLIPSYNADATNPADVYPLHNIIPEAEWKAISLSAFSAVQTEKERLALFPSSRSNWIKQHVKRIFGAPSLNKHDAKILFYISAMLAFRSATFRLGDKQSVYKRLGIVPTIIIDGLLARFTETSRDSSQAQSTSQTETSLLTHILALMLHLDRFATDSSLVAGDLNMTLPKLNAVFKSLGCKIEKLKTSDLKRLDLPASAAETKRAILRVPLEFPKPRARRQTRV